MVFLLEIIRRYGLNLVVTIGMFSYTGIPHQRISEYVQYAPEYTRLKKKKYPQIDRHLEVSVYLEDLL